MVKQEGGTRIVKEEGVGWPFLSPATPSFMI